MKCVIYARISSEQQNIDNSIDDKLKRFDVIMDYSLLDKIKF